MRSCNGSDNRFAVAEGGGIFHYTSLVTIEESQQ